MKILAPVNSLQEGKALLKEGAQELYCGLNPEVCFKKNETGSWLNRREPGIANLKSMGELKELVKVAHEGEGKVFLTLNQPSYDPKVYQDILAMIEGIEESIGVDAYIVADPALIRLLKENYPHLVIHVSSLAAVLNSAAVSFFSQLGVKRIVFPRYLPLATMENIIKESGNHLEYEAFILNDGCVFEEGYCFVSHGFGGAFCHNPDWRYKPIKVNWQEKADEQKVKRGYFRKEKEDFQMYLDEYKRWLWIGIKNFGGISGYKGYPLGMCGICALAQLKDMGVTSLKIVGREAPLKKKVASVRLVKEVLDYLEEGHSPDKVKNFAKSIRGTKGLCESGYMCYYR